ncbi:MAG: rna pseudouridylate synthase [Verrucomicrobiaceae bacterium]|nr:rna pseudouridylate synthase [Verrucomicrobiaceae bacterium]MDB6117596.1 rna pseudouridylate synthase [Verrucomicrobiaceae bacterium]
MGVIANNPRFTILAETDDYIVVSKPAPLKVHPSSPDGAPTLYDELRGLLAYELLFGGQISIINRLDRETSGVTLVAKTQETARRFGMAMMAHKFHKTYQAIVHGWPEWEERDLSAPILRKGEITPSPIYVKQMVHEKGTPCRTRFKVLRRFEGADGRRFALIACEPVTGRMHQIRVHLSHLGYPLVGDKMYGPDETCYLDFIVTGWTDDLERRLLLKRHALHSARLELEGGEAWEAPLPDDLAAFLSTKPTA